MIKTCYTTDITETLFITDIEYLSGATTFSIVGSYDFPVAVDSVGIVTIDIASIPVGVYSVRVKYFVGEVVHYIAVEFAIEDCSTRVLEGEIKVCSSSGEQTSQIIFNDGSTFSNFTLEGTPTGITISSTGLLTIDSGTASTGTITINYGDGESHEMSIVVMNCATPVQTGFIECEKESIGIVWINQEGARQSYWFNQPKQYPVDQKGGENWINNSREKRYFNRGRVDYGVSISQEHIPFEHIASLESLKNSIQAWTCTDISDITTYRSIFIKEDSWISRETTSRFYTIGFQFVYSKAKLIQKQ